MLLSASAGAKAASLGPYIDSRRAGQVLLSARRRIAAGEELFYSYAQGVRRRRRRAGGGGAGVGETECLCRDAACCGSVFAAAL